MFIKMNGRQLSLNDIKNSNQSKSNCNVNKLGKIDINKHKRNKTDIEINLNQEEKKFSENLFDKSIDSKYNISFL
jgi:hypothetical protein